MTNMRYVADKANNKCSYGLRGDVQKAEDFDNVPLSQVGSNKKAAMQLEAKFFFRISLLLSDSSGYSWVFLGVSGNIGYHLSFGGS